jgi:branched-chain amino acid transport system substrate-binding protein
MKRTSVYIVIAVLLIGLALAVTIRRNRPANTIRLGSILVLSGDYKSLGEQVRDGQSLAVDEINSKAGTGNRVEVEFYDSQGEKAIALEKLKTLDRDGVKFIAEIFGSPSASHSMSFVSQQNMLFVSGVDTGASLTENGGKHFFRIIPSDRLACQQISNKAMSMGYNTAAVVYINDEWGNGLRGEFEREYQQAGGQISASIETGKGQDLFQPVVSTIKSKAPKLVLLFIYPREAALLVKEARRQHLDAAFIGTDNLTGAEVTDVAGDAAIGVMYVVPRPPEESEASKHFKQLYAQKFGPGKEPPIFAVLGYDVVHLLAKAAADANGDISKATSILEAMRMDGASGRISFDKNHELVVADYQLKVYKKAGDKIAAANYEVETVKK